MRFRTSRVFLVVLGATLLLQTAWILALPAFRGIDEFDHVYKAHSVVHGHLHDRGPSPSDHGTVVVVPQGVVEAASRMCASYPYTGPANCKPMERLGGGMVSVASGAGSYNPAYYVVVGWVALIVDDAVWSVFALRAVTALLAALLIAWAASVTLGWARNTWPMLALLVSATPVLVYSTAVVSPNGITYAAGCLLWASGISLVEGARPRYDALAVAALSLVVTHTTGLMWLAGVALVVGVLQGPDQWRQQWREHRRPALRALGVVAVTGLAALLWIVTASTNSLPATANGTPFRWGELIVQQLAWTLQTIAAFPVRNEFAPVVVYALWGLPFLALVSTGVWRADSRTRTALGLLLAMWLSVPMVLTFLSYSTLGYAWQGRYALPLAVGFMALTGLALNRRQRECPIVVADVLVVMCAVAHSVSCVTVAWKEHDSALAPVFAAELPGGLILIGLLALCGTLLPLLLVPRRTGREGSLRSRTPQCEEVTA